jgi:hypothetical protein
VDKVRAGIRQERTGILADREGLNVFKDSNNVALIEAFLRVVKLEFGIENSALVTACAVIVNDNTGVVDYKMSVYKVTHNVMLILCYFWEFSFFLRSPRIL